jgi:hypothetical protein
MTASLGLHSRLVVMMTTDEINVKTGMLKRMPRDS